MLCAHGLPTECLSARSHLLALPRAVQQNLEFLGKTLGWRSVDFPFFSAHRQMILCPTEKAVATQELGCYPWCEAISRGEVLEGAAQKLGPGEREGTLREKNGRGGTNFLPPVESAGVLLGVAIGGEKAG